MENEIEQLLKIVEKLGWSIAIPHIAEDDIVPGLIIGTIDYIDLVLKHIPAEIKFIKTDIKGKQENGEEGNKGTDS